MGVQLPIAVLTTPRLRHHGRTHVRAYRGKNHGIQKQVLTDLGNQRFVVDGVPEKCLDGALFDFQGWPMGMSVSSRKRKPRIRGFVLLPTMPRLFASHASQRCTKDSRYVIDEFFTPYLDTMLLPIMPMALS